MNEARKESLVDGVIIGATQAVVLVLILVSLTFALGNQQAQQEHYQAATACELAIPVTSHGRDPKLVEKCFSDQGLTAPVLVTP
jgi:hypothetical protein